jgi:hypothetical protein
MTAIIKKVTRNDYNSEMIDYAQTIDFTELFNHVKSFINVKCKFNQPKITTGHNNNVHISFTSSDIASQVGAFSVILITCNLVSFNNGVYKQAETGELGYWVNIDIEYQHKDGGNNGMEVTRAWYSDSKGWEFQSAGVH